MFTQRNSKIESSSLREEFDMVKLISKLFRIKTPEEKFIAKWKSAVKHQDKDKMLKMLNDQLKSCSHRNSNCGIELFCPECPMVNPVQNSKYVG